MSADREIPTIEVDGISVPLGAIWIHHQRDPYPAGHYYWLHLPDSLTLVLAERYGKPIVADIRDDSRLILYWLSSVFSERIATDQREPEAKTMYVINSAFETRLNEDGSLDIHGGCSPYLTSSDKTPLA